MPMREMREKTKFVEIIKAVVKFVKYKLRILHNEQINCDFVL